MMHATVRRRLAQARGGGGGGTRAEATVRDSPQRDEGAHTHTCAVVPSAQRALKLRVRAREAPRGSRARAHHQRRVCRVGLEALVPAGFEQQGRRLCLILEARAPQRRAALPVGQVDRSAVLEQQRTDLQRRHDAQQ